MSRFVIACGGTRGHLSPGIALAEGLMDAGHACRLVISEKAVDARQIEKYQHLDYTAMPGCGFSFRPVQLVKFNLLQTCALFKALKLLLVYRPDAVIGFGGFVTVSVVFAAFILRLPIVLHEANRKPGKTIRLFSGLARRLYLPPGVRLKGVSSTVLRHCGLPLRKEIGESDKFAVRKHFPFNPHQKILLVLGGRQGAQVLNEWVVEHFETLAAEHINVYCLTGIAAEKREPLEYRNSAGQVVRAIFEPFSDNVSELLSMADLVVSRAGAGSIAEFIRCRIPAILIPYPHAADDHQLANARFHECQGGGVLVPESALDQLLDEVLELIYNDWLLMRLKRNLRRIDSRDAVQFMVKDLESMVPAKENQTQQIIASEKQS